MENLSSTIKNTYRFGVKAFYSLLKENELNAIPLKKAISRDLKSGILFIIAPDKKDLSYKEIEALKKWLSKGNTLVFLSNKGNIYTDKNYIYERTLISFLKIHSNYQGNIKNEYRYKPIFENKFTHNVKSVVINYMGTTNMRLAQKTSIPVLASENKSKIYCSKYKNGRVFFFPSVYPISNEGINKEDNLLFLLNIIYNVPHENIYFDEYHHHIFGNVFYLDLKQRRYIGYAFLLLLLGFILFIFKSYKRFGIIYPLERKTEVSILEFTRALGNLYAFAKKDKNVFMEYYDLFLKRLAHQYGIRSGDRKGIFKILKVRGASIYNELIALDKEYEKVLGNFKKRTMVEFVKKLQALEKKYTL